MQFFSFPQIGPFLAKRSAVCQRQNQQLAANPWASSSTHTHKKSQPSTYAKSGAESGKRAPPPPRHELTSRHIRLLRTAGHYQIKRATIPDSYFGNNTHQQSSADAAGNFSRTSLKCPAQRRQKRRRHARSTKLPALRNSKVKRGLVRKLHPHFVWVVY